jgi:ketosteroid isomerase-like protein
MSQENVELVERLYDAWNRRDEEELLALSDPEVEFVNSPTAIEPGTRRGTNEVLAAARMQWEFLRDGRFEIDRTYDHGEEILALGRLSRLMPEGDVRIEDRVLNSWVIRDGKVVRAEVLGFGGAEVDQALEAAGLSE